MGSAHAIPDAEFARDWLDKEIANLTAGPDEPMVDVISPDGRMVRINLRPFLAAGCDRTKLLNAFIKTANSFKSSESKLRQYWLCAEKMADDAQLPFTKKQLHKYFSEMEKQNLPAVHHSGIYEDNYKPAYRVIVHKYLSEDKD